MTDDFVPYTRIKALYRIHQLREFRRAANAMPDSDLAEVGRAVWRIAVAADPDQPPEVTRARLNHEAFRASLGWHAAELRKLITRRRLQRRPLDPNNDEELRRALDAAEEEELASLIPKRGLRKVSTSRGARFTYHDDEYHRQRPHLEARRQELAEAIEESGRRLDRDLLQAQLKVLEREYALAKIREAAGL